jgi:hypothetical protein
MNDRDESLAHVTTGELVAVDGGGELYCGPTDPYVPPWKHPWIIPDYACPTVL